jgi:hypothetical protein
VDGTLIPIDRVAADRPFYSGKHKTHGMNLQVFVSPDGDLLWVSGRCPARCSTRRPSGSGASWPNWRPAGLVTLADKGYQRSAYGKIPHKGKNRASLGLSPVIGQP